MRIPGSIRSERVLIRPFGDEDLAGYLAFMTDAEATRYLLLEPEQKTQAGARALFDLVVQSYDTDEPIWALAITTEADGFIGSCGIAPVDGTIFECYFSLLPAHWGQGYATEAIRALLAYVFGNTPVTEIRAYMNPQNSNAPGVAERVGMHRKGPHVHPSFGNEGLLYAVTKEEWESQQHRCQT